MRRRWALVGAVAALATMPACDAARQSARPTLTTNTPGVLTVATTLPAPGFWNGDRPDAVSGGFEWGIAHELARRSGLELRIVATTFDRIDAGDLAGADMAIAQVSVTDERRAVMDFSLPYYDSDAGVLARDGREMRDLQTAREAAWAVVAGTTEEDFVRTVIRPTAPTLTVDSEQAVVDALDTGDAEAALVDLPTALVLSAAHTGLDTVARFATGERFAIVLPRGSTNRDPVDTLLRGLTADGTIDRLERTWLEPLFSRPPDDVPVIRART